MTPFSVHPLDAPAPPAGSRSLLQAFLGRVEQGLRGLPTGRRARVLEDLEAHLVDGLEAEARRDPAFRAETYFAGQDPEALARALVQAESRIILQRSVAAILAALALALPMAAFMLAAGHRAPRALVFATGYGLSVGFALLWFRDRWWGLRPALRWLASLGTGTVAAIPWAFLLNARFDAPMIFYGALSGFFLQRYSRKRSWRIWLGDNLWVTATAFLLAGWESGWDAARVGLHLIPWAMAFHLALQGGLALGVGLYRRLGYWFLERDSETRGC